MRAALRQPAVAFGAALLVLVGGYVALVPSLHLAPGMTLFNGKRALQLVVLGGVAAWLLFSKPSRTAWLEAFGRLPAAARFMLAALGSLGLASALRAPLPAYALLEVGHCALLVGVAGAVAAAAHRMPRAASTAIVGVMALGAGLYALTFAVGYGLHLAGDAVALWPNAHTGFANIRFFNQYQTWTLPFIVAAPALLAGRSRLLRGGLFGLAMLWWALLIASGGRGAMLAAGASSVAVLCIFRRSAWPWLKGQFAACAGGAALFALSFKAVTSTQASLLERSMSDGRRFVAWGDALETMANSPLLGVGPLHYAYHPFGNIWASPHSAPLRWGAEWGLPALALLVALTGWGLWAWMRQTRADTASARHSEGEPRVALLRVAVAAALLAGGAHAWVSGLLSTPMSQMLLALVMGWAWGLHRFGEPAEAKPRRAAHRMVQGVLVAALIAVGWGASRDIFRLEEKQERFIEQEQPARLWPRYWQQGFIGYDDSQGDGS